METQPYGDLSKARILVIGHDPRLQNTDTIAPYCFFADYYFRPQPMQRSERAKYGLASALFSCVTYLTSDKFSAEQLMVTNLCNKSLPHAPPKKTVLISEKDAREGLIAIRNILAASNIEIIFAMSLQVNYWLQSLGFYSSADEFVAQSKPKQVGLQSIPPYYEPIKLRTFQMICGNRYLADNKYALFPILHIKQWPLKGKFALAYDKAYDNCRNAFNSM